MGRVSIGPTALTGSTMPSPRASQPTNLTNLIIGAVLGGIFGSFVLLFTTIKLREVVKSIKETVKANAVAAQRTSPATAITYAEAQSSVVPPGPVGLTFAGNKVSAPPRASPPSPPPHDFARAPTR